MLVPWPGIEPWLWQWKCSVLTTGPPGSSWQFRIKAVLLSLWGIIHTSLALRERTQCKCRIRREGDAFKYFYFILSLSKCIFIPHFPLPFLVMLPLMSYFLLISRTPHLCWCKWAASQQSLGACSSRLSILKWDHLAHSSLKSLESSPFWKLPFSVLSPRQWWIWEQTSI